MVFKSKEPTALRCQMQWSLSARMDKKSISAFHVPKIWLLISLASWYNHDCSIDQLPHIPPSVDSAVEKQSFSPNCSRSLQFMLLVFSLQSKASNKCRSCSLASGPSRLYWLKTWWTLL